MRWRDNRGFTLLEMLVALTVFALISAMVFTGQRAVLSAKQQTDARAERLRRLQSTQLMLEQDIDQMVLRGVRDEYGDAQPALSSSDLGTIRLALTRGGWLNPLGLPRSTLQRVAYGIEEDALVRYSWSVLDRAQDSEPYKVVLLDDVRALKIRFLDQQHQWQSQWPAPVQGDKVAPPTLPLALEVTLELADWGEIRRLFPTASGTPLPSESVSAAGASS